MDLGVSSSELAGLPAREAVDHIAQAISPSDGSQDAEASRESTSQALLEVLKEHPDADLSALTEAQIDLAMERFIGNDLCKRIELDVGKAIFDKAPDPVGAISRLKQMQRFVHQCVAAQFRSLRNRGERLSTKSAAQLGKRVLGDTLAVFEGYVE